MWFQSAVLVGVLGGYMTFSTLSLELFLLMERGQVLFALAYATGSVVGGVIAFYGRIVLARVMS